jgi:tetratricopeptide (TPR) repeat protein/SAM-dependent methyltransferase
MRRGFSMYSENIATNCLLLTEQTRPYEQLAGEIRQVHTEIARNNLDQAVANLEQMMKSLPATTGFLNTLGSLYKLLGRFKEAQHQFSKATQIDSSEPLAYINLAATLFEQGKSAEAQNVLEQVRKIRPKDLTLLKVLAGLHRANNQPEKEVQIHLSILEQFPKEVDSLLFLANFHLQSGNQILARQLFGIALESGTRNTLSPQELGNYLNFQWSNLEPFALGISPQHNPLLQKALVATEKKDWQTAIDCYSNALAVPGLNPLLIRPLQDKILHLKRMHQLNLSQAKCMGGELQELDAEEKSTGTPLPPGPLISQVCRHSAWATDWFKDRCRELNLSSDYFHRKSWEFCFVAQVLKENSMISEGKKGLGFGVGREQLVALFAKNKCKVVATDLAKEEATRLGWVDTDQHSNAIEEIFTPGFCDIEQFKQLVEFRNVDMNAIPPDLCREEFDFTWSACAFEHVGSIRQGKQFIQNQMRCLRPGGVAVHTTEFNLSSNEYTIDNESTVFYRRCDIEEMARALQAEGHQIELDLFPGDGTLDQYIDIPPYASHPRSHHLKVLIGRHISTSIGLVIHKKR